MGGEKFRKVGRKEKFREGFLEEVTHELRLHICIGIM